MLYDKAIAVFYLVTMQKTNGIPDHMQRQVIGYYEYLWFRKKGVTDDGLMNDLPITFHAEVAKEANKHILDKVSLAQNDDQSAFILVK